MSGLRWPRLQGFSVSWGVPSAMALNKELKEVKELVAGVWEGGSRQRDQREPQSQSISRCLRNRKEASVAGADGARPAAAGGTTAAAQLLL